MLKAEASSKQNYTASMVHADMKSLHFGHQQDDNNNNSEMRNDYRYSALNQQQTERRRHGSDVQYQASLPA